MEFVNYLNKQTDHLVSLVDDLSHPFWTKGMDEELEKETDVFGVKARYKDIVSDCCGTGIKLVNSPMPNTESVYCESCGNACNAVEAE